MRLENKESTVALLEVLDYLLGVLDARSKDVITRRYGLRDGQPETLEGIGREYGITRERVRQIQSQAKKAISEFGDKLEPVKGVYHNIFLEHGGILTENHAAIVIQEKLRQDNLTQAAVAFFLDLLPPYQYVTRHSIFAPHWQNPELVLGEADQVMGVAKRVMLDSAKPTGEEELIERIRTAIEASEDKLPSAVIKAYLTASREIQKTPFGEWGLAGWPETNPRGVGDKAYAVLRRHGEPEHFTRITEMINESSFDHKKANPQTVHNELIKDERFVLVGRGLYGLAEWGFVAGTVADVIERILKEAKKPLAKEEVVNGVLNQRQVKKNTILLSLQNHKRFSRVEGNKYTIR